MTEEIKPPTEPTKPVETEPKPAPAPTADVKVPKGFVMISEGEFSGLRTKGKQLSELEKYKADIESAKSKEAEEALARQGKHEQIIGERDKRIAQLEQDQATSRHEALVLDATARLAGHVPSFAARRALAADWAAKAAEERAIEGAFEAFVEAQRQADPATFNGQSKPVEHSGGAGTVATGGGNEDLDARLLSKDPAIARQAVAEMIAGTSGIKRG